MRTAMICVIAMTVAARDGSGGETATQDSATTIAAATTSTVTAQAVVEGELIDMPGGVVPDVESDAVGNRSSFECADDTLVVTPEGGFAATFARVDG